MRNIKLTIEYDGTNYCGWQTQKNGPSIQEEIQKAIYKVTGEELHINGSGRTDAGVHARGQVASFETASRIPEEKIAFALNAVLPPDIVIRKSEEASQDFHARFSAKGKLYRYLIYNSRFPSALLRNYAYSINYCEKLDLEKMKKAAGCFVGTHDFEGFMAVGSKVKDTVRTIYSIDIDVNGELISISFNGNGFLYNMVRILTGTLVYAAIGRIEVQELPAIINSRDRTRAGVTAPAQGLYLEEVYY